MARIKLLALIAEKPTRYSKEALLGREPIKASLIRNSDSVEWEHRTSGKSDALVEGQHESQY